MGWGTVFTFYNGIDCKKNTDKFSIYNSKAKLTYPVGLATKAELSLLNSHYLIKTGSPYHVLNSTMYSLSNGNSAYLLIRNYVDTNGYVFSDFRHEYNTTGVRPVISLKPGTEYSIGDGSKDNPYIVLVDD